LAQLQAATVVITNMAPPIYMLIEPGRHVSATGPELPGYAFYWYHTFMNGEAAPAAGQPHEGEKYLELLGLGHLANQPLPGREVLGRDFLDICGDEARPALAGLASLDPKDPRFSRLQVVLRTHISRYITPSEG
jgi:hypothetical protein